MAERSVAGVERIKDLLRPLYRRFLGALPASVSVTLRYLRAHRRLPNLENPQTFNEKVLWRMLYERDPRLPDLVDKVKVKEIMAGRFGEDFVIPTLGVYRTADEMDFGRPPLSRPPYVLKVNHSAKMNVFVREPSFDADAIRKQMAAFLDYDHAAVWKEWAYSRVQRRILVEPYIESPGDSLTDYKIHVFSGVVYAIEMITGRFGSAGNSVYDRNWKRMDMEYGFSSHEVDMPRPERLGEMIGCAEAIGSEFSYVRVDLYLVEGRIKLGELTFYPGAGTDRFCPEAWDLKFGQQWKLDRGGVS